MHLWPYKEFFGYYRSLRMSRTISQEFTLSITICYREDFLRKVQKNGRGWADFAPPPNVTRVKIELIFEFPTIENHRIDITHDFWQYRTKPPSRPVCLYVCLSVCVYVCDLAKLFLLAPSQSQGSIKLKKSGSRIRFFRKSGKTWIFGY